VWPVEGGGGWRLAVAGGWRLEVGGGWRRLAAAGESLMRAPRTPTVYPGGWLREMRKRAVLFHCVLDGKVCSTN